MSIVRITDMEDPYVTAIIQLGFGFHKSGQTQREREEHRLLEPLNADLAKELLQVISK